ncbi:MAG: serine hydrolase [Pyrinomonadaceae bacterium]
MRHVFRVATGLDIEDYAVRYLFSPLGIKQHFWKRSPSGLVDAEGGVYLRPRDLAKLWYLFQKNGKWDGKQIVTPEWVKDSLTPHMDLGPNAKYGLKWWLYPYGPENKYFAWSGNGFGGQLPMVLPEYDLVVVYTAWNVNPGAGLRRKDAIDRIVALIAADKK